MKRINVMKNLFHAHIISLSKVFLILLHRSKFTPRVE